MNTYVMGIDGGGSHTRVAVADQHGRLLSYVQKGGCSRYHDIHAEQNVLEGIAEAITQAGLKSDQIAAIQAGMAGLNRPEDTRWAEALIARTGIIGKISAVNDTHIAHTAAFDGEPGIVAIGGTGSLILGRTEQGAWLRNDQFGHYAPTAARFLAYDTVHSILAGRYELQDEEWIEQVLTYWQVSSVRELAALGVSGFGDNQQATNRRFGQMAPLVTEAAVRNIPLAVRVCDSAADTAVVGILMLASCFDQPTVSMAMTGSCLSSPYMVRAVQKGLDAAYRPDGKRIQYITSDLLAVGGALLDAYHLAQIKVWDNISTVLQSELNRYTT
ncbi:BadF/BadG/BcrA/BcrD ATPase family protein [Paenibacillus sp. 1781tsa1]|uniref:BadF/BadG/BcrA/BcrD ATPase family protein n=1 Tax=Paenibacillus sp. 1781tsa1 TaxID=2953810 RepID=UPI0020A03D85|nr:BadF/BadG/BcrA/BcrD ATPase family protein [Paenibacillus sp. 1781tsa1]MCP1183490.1 ATPase [Paenibacillus sp. 1781tsa1]